MVQKHRFLYRFLFALLLFGFNGIVASRISLESGQIVLLRTLLGSLSLLLFFFLSGHRFSFTGKGKGVILICLSGAAMGASWMFLYAGYQRIGVSAASLLYYCGSVIVMALSPLIFHETLKWEKVSGFLLVCTGIVLVNGWASGGDLLGFFYGSMSAVCFAAMLILSKRAQGVEGMENSLLQMISATITVFFLLLSNHGLTMSISGSDWPWILLLGIVNTGFGCWYYFSAIRMLPVQTVAVCGYLEPLSAVIFSALLLHEQLTTIQIFGAMLIIGGAPFAECFRPRTRKRGCLLKLNR